VQRKIKMLKKEGIKFKANKIDKFSRLFFKFKVEPF